jgi:hypothetical protein
MNEDLKRELIEFIIAQLRNIEGEMIIENALKNSDEVGEVRPNDIFEVLKMIKQDFRGEMDFMKKLYHNDGKFEAYVNILSKLDCDYNSI